MNKKSIAISIILILFIIGLGIYFFNLNNNKSTIGQNENTTNFMYNSTRVSTTENNSNTNASSSENTSEPSANTGTEQNQSSITSSEEQKNESTSQAPTETQIAEFTTKIYTKDSERQNNISITCSSLNGTTINSGDTFSFCSTVGKATTSKGYQKADVYKDGEVVQALGGGNCQVSSTLYNAVLKIPELKVTERHEHSNSVPYVSKGKDAAVAYGSYDFKFVNNTGNQIKISASNDNNYVYIKILKIE